MHAIQAECNKKMRKYTFSFFIIDFHVSQSIMSKWTYIVYQKSGIQKDILAIQCQMLNLCNDTKPSNHLSSQ